MRIFHRPNTSIAKIIVIGFFATCGILACAESKYDPGPLGGNDRDLGLGDGASDDGDGSEGADPVPTKPPSPEPTPDDNSGTADDTGGGDTTEDPYAKLETGVPDCVSEKITKFRPLKIERELSDFGEADTATAPIDFIELGDLLLREVVTAERGLVDYESLRTTWQEQWKLLIRGLGTIAPPTGTYEEKLSYWINAYNFLMMDRIVENPGIFDVEDMDGGGFNVFKEQHLVGGHQLSLNQIEYWILKLGSVGQRPIQDKPSEDLIFSSKEVRLHSALVCGAMSCPRLRNFAYRAKDLEILLEENFHLFINHEGHIAANGEGFSELFSWFKEDFLFFADQELPNIPKKYILESCRADKDRIVAAFEDAQSSRFPKIIYDWKVNGI